MNEELKDLALKYLLELRRECNLSNEQRIPISVGTDKYLVTFKIEDLKKKRELEAKE